MARDEPFALAGEDAVGEAAGRQRLAGNGAQIREPVRRDPAATATRPGLSTIRVRRPAWVRKVRSMVGLRKCLQPEGGIAAQAPGRGADLHQAMTDRRIAAPERRHATCPHSIRICAPRHSLRSHECGTLRLRQGKRCVGDVKHPARQANGGCRDIRRPPSPATADRLRGLGNLPSAPLGLRRLRCIRPTVVRPRRLRRDDCSTFRLLQGKRCIVWRRQMIHDSERLMADGSFTHSCATATSTRQRRVRR